MSQAPEPISKKFWESKIFWVNLVAIIAIVVQFATDSAFIDVKWQALILAVANGILRLFFTDTNLTQ
jgi:hypothetical protein